MVGGCDSGFVGVVEVIESFVLSGEVDNVK